MEFSDIFRDSTTLTLAVDILVSKLFVECEGVFIDTFFSLLTFLSDGLVSCPSPGPLGADDSLALTTDSLSFVFSTDFLTPSGLFEFVFDTGDLELVVTFFEELEDTDTLLLQVLDMLGVRLMLEPRFILGARVTSRVELWPRVTLGVRVRVLIKNNSMIRK